LAAPIVSASTFEFDSQNGIEAYYSQGRGYLYSRYENPTVRCAEKALAALEDAEDAAAFASGMAAISTTILALARSGDTIAAQRQLYGGTASLLRELLPDLGIRVMWFDAHEIAAVDPDEIRGCSIVFVETPTNPTLRIVDLERVARSAHSAGALCVVDATFATPALLSPIRLGCDLVVHSATKYLGGHSDLTAGAVAGRSTLVSRIAHRRRMLGGCLDPFAAFLLQRGMRTLAVRMEAAERGAEAVARALADHPRVERVHWPGLSSHPDHALARDQMRGFGAMVTFEVRGGAAAAQAVHDRLEVFVRAASLGGVESLVSIPARMSHRALEETDLARSGITAGMLRLSVGLESPDDLVADLERALG
jgi:cystathionine beta-lyase/cystathionine gamma-synthase